MDEIIADTMDKQEVALGHVLTGKAVPNPTGVVMQDGQIVVFENPSDKIKIVLDVMVHILKLGFDITKERVILNITLKYPTFLIWDTGKYVNGLHTRAMKG